MSEFHVLAAVVDRVCAPTEVSVDNEPHSVTARAQKPPVSDDGFEGLAYAVMNPAALGRPVDLEHGSETPPYISFKMRGKRDPRHELALDYEVKLPLANTIFQNGREYTMKHMIFKRPKNYKPFKLKHVAPFKQHSITWPAHLSGKFGKPNVSLSSPLVPLTVPLRIETAMGNIVSRVSNHDKTLAPASQQLEASVHEYFQATNTTPQSVSVWALMYPAPTEYAMQSLSTFREDGGILSEKPLGTLSEKVIRTYWQPGQGWNDHILRSVWRGAKLHKVVSGGGGWGKKAGLLSLDPYAAPLDTSISDSPSVGLTSFNFVQGDYIQFFICPPQNQHDEPQKDVSPPAPREWSLEFGSMTSAMDAMPPAPNFDTSEDAKIQVYPNHFGALSEKGFTIQNKYSKYTPRGYEEFKPFAYTKVDVPHSRWSALGSLPEVTERSLENTPGAITSPGAFQIQPVGKQPRRFDDIAPGGETAEGGYWKGVRFEKRTRKIPSLSAKDVTPAERSWLLLQREQRHRESRNIFQQRHGDMLTDGVAAPSIAEKAIRRKAMIAAYRKDKAFTRSIFVTQPYRSKRERAVSRHFARDYFIRQVSILSTKDRLALKKNNEVGVEARHLDGGYGAERRRRKRLRSMLLGKRKDTVLDKNKRRDSALEREAAAIKASVDDLLEGFGKK